MKRLGYYSNMKKIAGFTLIELMITLLVLAVVAGMAVPSMQTMMKNNKQTSRINQLAGLLNFARSEAVNQRQIVSACASSDGASCDTNEWELGGLIFRGNAATTAPDADSILRVIEPQAAGSTLRRISDQSAAPAGFNASYIRYDSTGRLLPGETGSFVLCDDRGEGNAKGLLINSTGQTRNAVDTDDDGIVEIFIDNAPEAVECP